jgi:hypothetical protein
MRDDGNVNPDAVVPVVIDVGVFGDVRMRAQAHEARAAPNDAQAGKHLAQVGRLLQVRGGLHDAIHVVVLSAAHGDQPDRGVAANAIRMIDPGLAAECQRFTLQRLDIEAYRETIKGLRQAHGVGRLQLVFKGLQSAHPRDEFRHGDSLDIG